MVFALALTGAILAATWARGEEPQKNTRYSNISQRNAFGLRPPPEPPPPPAPPPPSITVKITGIINLFSKKKAVLQITEAGKTESKIIAEGDREGQIQVVSVDVDVGVVKIMNGDREVTLNMEENGVKPTAPPPQAKPAIPLPGMPPGQMPPGVVMPGGPPAMPMPSAPGQPPNAALPPGAYNPSAAATPNPNLPQEMSRPLRTPSSDRMYMRVATNAVPGQ